MSTLNLKTVTTNRRAWLLLALLLVLIATIGMTSLKGFTPTTQPTDEGLALWQSQNIQNYRYTLQVGCFCIRDMTYPVVVEVHAGKVAGISYVSDGSTANPQLFEAYDSIDKLFAVIDRAKAQNPVQLDVVYDEAIGVPLFIDIDIDLMMADEELYLEVSDFERLP